MKAFEDPNHEGNSANYHTGKPCIENGCEQPAGTWWSALWCREHNAERLNRISSSLDDIAAKYAKDKADAEAGYRACLDGQPKPSTENYQFWRGWHIADRELNDRKREQD